MKTFKEYILESTITVPPNVIEPIRKYILDTYKEVVNKGVSKLNKKERIFILNLKDTKYEFLNSLAHDYPLNVKLIYAPKFTAEEYYSPEKTYGEIIINIADLNDVYHNVLEHELVHYLQHLLNKNVGINDWKKNFAGGMPSPLRNMIKDLTFHGYNKTSWDAATQGKKSWNAIKRTKHMLRPIEHQSNMVTMLHNLLYTQYTNPGIPKNKIFADFLKTNYRMVKLKQSRPEQYREYAKQLYSAFTDDRVHRLKTYRELSNFIDHINKLKKENKGGEEIVFWGKTYDVNMKKYNYAPITSSDLKNIGTSEPIDRLNYWDYSNVDDGNNSERGEYILVNYLGLKEHESKDGYSYVRIPSSYDSMKTIFKKLQKTKKEFLKLKYNPFPSVGPDVTPEQEAKNIDYAAAVLANTMSDTIEYKIDKKIMPEEIYNRFYLNKPLPPKPNENI